MARSFATAAGSVWLAAIAAMMEDLLDEGSLDLGFHDRSACAWCLCRVDGPGQRLFPAELRHLRGVSLLPLQLLRPKLLHLRDVLLSPVYLLPPPQQRLQQRLQ